jgi:putative inorganic carbon (HCO3(-)) transporter
MRFDRTQLIDIFWVLVLAAGFAASIFFTGVHSTLIAPIIGAFLAYLAASAVYPALREGRVEIPRTATVFLILSFLLYVAISPLWSTIPYNSVLFVYIIGVLPLLFFGIVLAPDPQRQALYCFAAIGAVVTALAFWALIQFLFLFEIYGPRIHHPMLDPNNLTAMFGMGSLAALAFLLYAKTRRDITISSFFLLLFYAGLLVAQSRGGQVAVLAAGIVLVFMMGRKAPLIHLKLPFMICIGIILFVAVDYRLGLRIIGGFDSITSNFVSHATVTARLDLWRATLQIISEHPWLGTGLGTFYHYYPAYRPPTDSSDGFFVHMDSLQFWQEMGIAAPLLFYGIMIAALFRTIRALKTADDFARMRISGGFCGLLYIAAHSHITFHFYVLPILFPIAVLLAGWYIATEEALDERQKTLRFPAGLRSRLRASLASGLVFVLAMLWIGRAAAGIWLVSKVNEDFVRNDFPAAERHTAQAQMWSPNSYSKPHEYVGRLKAYQMKDMVTNMSPEQKLAVYEEGTEGFRQARLREPRSPYSRNFEAILNYLAFKQGVKPDGDKIAEEILKEILVLDPVFIDARMGLSTLYKDRGDKRSALKVLEEGLLWPKPKTVRTVQYLVETANLKKEFGDEKGHRQLIDVAKQMTEQANRDLNKK